MVLTDWVFLVNFCVKNANSEKCYYGQAVSFYIIAGFYKKTIHITLIFLNKKLTIKVIVQIFTV